MKRFKQILAVIDSGQSADSALERAVSLAQNNQARLTVLHVAEEPRLGPFEGSIRIEDFKTHLRRRATEQLSQLIGNAGGMTEAIADVRFGAVFVEIIREVLRNRHDLVIKTVGEGGALGFLFGGTDQQLLRKCPCPVWIIVGETSTNYRHSLAAVDFDPREEGDEKDNVDGVLNRQIINLAASLAASDFAQLHAVHAWQSITDNMIRVFSSDMPEKESAANRERKRREYQSRLDPPRLDPLDNRIREQFGSDVYGYLSPRFYLREGIPRDVVPEVATELAVDLVVMGTVSRTGIPGLLIGNTAEVILNNLACSVLAVKPPGFATPVTVD